MTLSRSCLLFVLSLCVTAGCNHAKNNSTSERRGTDAEAGASSFTGTLRGGAVAVGGETTGWRLIGDGQTGGIDLDISRVRDVATGLDGKRVTVTGRMTTHDFPERGSVQVLRVDTIKPSQAGR